MEIQETREQLEQELQQIAKWEKEQNGSSWLDRIGRIPFAVLDRLTPKFIRDKLGVALNEIGRFIQSGGSYLISPKAMMKKLAKASGQPDAELKPKDVARLPLRVMDDTALDLSRSRANLAAIEGAASGIGGIFTIAADIPAMIGISLKVLQEIALCYGYYPADPQERLFILKCLQFASSDVVGKKAVLQELANFEKADTGKEVFSQIQGWREVVTTYRDNFGWRKLFQAVPVAGILFGSVVNKNSLDGIAEAGRMLYRKRRIMERLRELDSPAALEG
ncbi:EcsC family protein [Paenibacillus hunanensis]|uniref:EcsC family protein n=1 Tax=Paenibacillus hunanensis TaxID=539262 RepID=UPI002A69B89E|nr:EcsC family protein [Paenibacillus hunanensis]WPP40464.1 EcsC family protein [Paenibacillus hunanensis]